MKKELVIFLVLVVIAGVALFFDDLLALIGGMSPLEMLQTLVSYLLHIAIGTVAAVVIFGLPEIAKPWMRYFKRHQRNKWRSGPNAQWQTKTPQVRAPKLTATLTMPKQTTPRPSSNPTRKVNIKW